MGWVDKDGRGAGGRETPALEGVVDGLVVSPLTAKIWIGVVLDPAPTTPVIAIAVKATKTAHTVSMRQNNPWTRLFFTEVTDDSC